MPETHMDLWAARVIAADPNSSRADLVDAAYVLATYGDCADIVAAREIRNAILSDEGSDLLPGARRLADRLGEMNRHQMRMDRMQELANQFGWVLLAVMGGILAALLADALLDGLLGLPDVLAQAEAMRGGM
ncbi:hypothetical protein [Gemmobacter denitrificans]|uniref:Uncharacterized protein n=1 Tax=Gemmobacter denitrificans TaxID=3123040 RepID=A0ABU8BSH8_9RHOB